MNTLAFIQNLRAPEIILIFLVVLLLFGAKRLPDLFKSFGKSIKEFKKATSDIEEDIRTAMDADDDAPKRTAPPQNQVETKSALTPAAPTEQAKSESEKSDNA